MRKKKKPEGYLISKPLYESTVSIHNVLRDSWEAMPAAFNCRCPVQVTDLLDEVDSYSRDRDTSSPGTLYDQISIFQKFRHELNLQITSLSKNDESRSPMIENLTSMLEIFIRLSVSADALSLRKTSLGLVQMCENGLNRLVASAKGESTSLQIVEMLLLSLSNTSLNWSSNIVFETNHPDEESFNFEQSVMSASIYFVNSLQAIMELSQGRALANGYGNQSWFTPCVQTLAKMFSMFTLERESAGVKVPSLHPFLGDTCRAVVPLMSPGSLLVPDPILSAPLLLSLSSCCNALNSKLLSKDARTQVSMASVCLARQYWRATRKWRELPILPLLPKSLTQDFESQQGAAEILERALFNGLSGKTSSKSQDDAEIQLINCTNHLNGVSMVAIARAVMSAVEPEILEITLPSGSNILCKYLAVIIFKGCEDTLPASRLYSFQALESWLMHAEACVQNSKNIPFSSNIWWENEKMLEKLLSKATVLIMGLWESPSKMVAAIAPKVFERLISLQELTVEGSDGYEKDALSSWSNIISKILDQPAEQKGKYMALSSLLPRLGATQLLKMQPEFIKSLLEAIGSFDNVASQAVQLLIQLLNMLCDEHIARLVSASTEIDLESFSESSNGNLNQKAKNKKKSTKEYIKLKALEMLRECWTKEAAEALTRLDSAHARWQISNLFIPEVLRYDPESVSNLCIHIRSLFQHESSVDAVVQGSTKKRVNNVSDNLTSYEIQLGAIIEVARRGRDMALPTKGFIVVGLPEIKQSSLDNTSAYGDALLSYEEVKLAAMHYESRLRFGALALLACDGRTSSLPSNHEIDLFKEMLPYSLKTANGEEQASLVRIVQILASRVRDSTRAAVKEIDHHKESVTARKKIATLKNMVYFDSEEPFSAIEVLSSGRNLIIWLCTTFLHMLYPGSPFSREVVAGSLLGSLTSVFESTHPIYACMKSLLQTPNASISLLNLSISSWDRSRRLAHDLLSKFPPPLSYCTADSTGTIISNNMDTLESYRIGAIKNDCIYVSTIDKECLNMATDIASISTTNNDSMASRDMDSMAAIKSGSNFSTNSFDKDVHVTNESHGIDTQKDSRDMIRMENNVSIETCGKVGISNDSLNAFQHDIKDTVQINRIYTTQVVIIDDKTKKNNIVDSINESKANISLVDNGIRLTRWGLLMTRSPRQRESDSGALILRHILRNYANKLGWLVPLVDNEHCAVNKSYPPSDMVSQFSATGPSGTAVLHYIEQLRAILALRLNGVQKVYEAITRVHSGANIHASLEAFHLGSGDFRGGKKEYQEVHTSGKIELSGMPISSKSYLDTERVTENDLEGKKMTNLNLLGTKKVPENNFASENEPPHNLLEYDNALNTGTEEGNVAKEGSYFKLVRPKGGVGEGISLAHGIISSLCYALEEVDWTLAVGNESWYILTSNILATLQEAILLALSVVSDSNDELDNETLEDDLHSSNKSISVDCRGHKIIGGEEGAWVPGDAFQDLPVEGGAEMELVVSGSWLMVKEAAKCLGTLVSNAVRYMPTHESPKPLLSYTQVKGAGDLLLYALQVLKHQGAVSTTATGFQAICESLMCCTSAKNFDLYNLCSIWIDGLLDRIGDSNQDLLLRRSGGFAYAFQALLRAEPRNRPPSLLPKVMIKLISLARPKSIKSVFESELEKVAYEAATCRAQVHSLNVIRLTFIDSTLAPDIISYVSESLMAAMDAFEHPQFTVRNSGMMVLSAVIQRSICNQKNDAGRKSAVTVQGFFDLYPDMHQYLLKQLRRIIGYPEIPNIPYCGVPSDVHLQSNEIYSVSTISSGDLPDVDSGRNRIESGPNGGSAALHPLLHPTLLLLSRLRPALCSGSTVRSNAESKDFNVEVEDTGYAAPLIPLVIQATKESVHWMARAMGARALSSLVSTNQRLSVVTRLVETLPSHTLNGFYLNHNALHGTLLQILELLKSAVAQRPKDYSTINFTFKALLFEKSWLYDAKILRCPSIRTVALDILSVLYSCKEELDVCIFEGKSEFMEIFSEFALKSSLRLSAAVNGYMLKETLDLPGEALTTKQACLIWATMQLTEPHAVNRLDQLIGLLSCKDNDICDTVIKTFKKAAKNVTDGQNLGFPVIPIVIMERLQNELISMLRNESHPPNKQRILKCLCRLSGKFESNNSTVDKLPGVWELFEENTLGGCSGSSLELMGKCIKFSKLSQDQVNKWVDKIFDASKPSSPIAMRHSACLSMSASAILAQPANEVVIQLWFNLIQLLQDDDENIREMAAITCCSALSAFRVNQSISNGSLTNQHLPSCFVGLRAIEAAYTHLYNICLNSIHYECFMVTLLNEAIDCGKDAVTLLTNHAQSAPEFTAGALSRALFEPEEDNLHYETVLTVQHIALILSNILHKKSSVVFACALILERCEIILKRSVEVLKILPDACVQSYWIGSATAHPLTFSAVYASLLIASTISKWCNYEGILKKHTSDLSKLAKSILHYQNIELHPSIRDILIDFSTVGELPANCDGASLFLIKNEL